MPRMIFVNLPVADLPAAMRFYAALGFVNQPKFTDATAAAMRWSETIMVMLVSHPRWREFTARPLPAPGASEVSLCFSCEDRAEVDRLTEAASAGGGVADVNPSQDHGFMYGRSFTDLDDHVWEPVWMDPAFAASEEPTPSAA